VESHYKMLVEERCNTEAFACEYVILLWDIPAAQRINNVHLNG